MERPKPGPAPEGVYDLLYQLGLSVKSAAFFHLAYTVRLAANQPQRLLAASWLYPETARHYGAAPETVEQNIRRLKAMVWLSAPEKLSQLAGAPLKGPPSTIRFVAILASALGAQDAA